MFFLAAVMVVSALVSLVITPMDLPIAKHLGAMDVPKDGRRMHSRPIPRLGGLTLFSVFFAICLIFGFRSLSTLFYPMAAGILLMLLGVLDDILALPAGLKLTVQVVAAGISAVGGPRLDTVSLGGQTFFLGSAGFFLTVLWTVALINAHNFIDGLDGLCGGVSMVECLALGTAGLRLDQPLIATLCFALAGACIGFLPYNINGAKLFMGDCGSTFLGFSLAWLSTLFMESTAAPSIVSLWLIFAIPLLDITVAVTRRVLGGKSPFCPDRSHIHHLLADTPLGHVGASRLLRFAAALFAAIGVFLIEG